MLPILNHHSFITHHQGPSSTPQPALHILSYPLLHRLQLPLRRIKPRTNLIKRILRALLKLLPHNIYPLPPPQPLHLLLQLRQPPGLVRRIRGLVPPLGMAVDLLGIRICGKGQGVEGVVDVRGVEGRRGFVGHGRLVELGKVEAPRLLDGSLSVLRSDAGVLLFFSEEGVFFGFFAGGFFAFRGGLFSVEEQVYVSGGGALIDRRGDWSRTRADRACKTSSSLLCVRLGAFTPLGVFDGGFLC